MPLRDLVETEKTIPVQPKWTAPEPAGDGYIRLSVPLEIDGVTFAGLTLSGGAYAQHPEQHVTFELSVHDAVGRHIRLARIDWRSLKGGHTNHPRHCAGPWRRARVPETHLHSFDLNWSEAEGRMKRGKLPCAEPISQPLQAFAELRTYAGTCFRIKNIDVVPPPDWVYDLFK